MTIGYPFVSKAHQRRVIRVSEIFEENRSNGDARLNEEKTVCPSGLSRSDWGYK
jgi:hypothetical protein